MTRSSEKLEGDWEARIAANVRPTAGGAFFWQLATYVAFVIIAATAIFGFR